MKKHVWKVGDRARQILSHKDGNPLCTITEVRRQSLIHVHDDDPLKRKMRAPKKCFVLVDDRNHIIPAQPKELKDVLNEAISMLRENN